MLFNFNKFGEKIHALTHSMYGQEEGGSGTPPVFGDKILIEDLFDMLTEDLQYIKLEG